MEYVAYGWPAPVIWRAQFWWPWDDPLWKTSVNPDSGHRLHAAGLVTDTVVCAAMLWIVLVTPRVWRWYRRAHTGRCPRCGYLLTGNVSGICPECGETIPSHVRLSHASAERFPATDMPGAACVRAAPLEPPWWVQPPSIVAALLVASGLGVSVCLAWLICSFAPTQLRGEVAAAQGWPVAPPLPWPAPTDWQEPSSFGVRHYDVRSAPEGKPGHSMDYRTYGWPAPGLWHRRLWWPWNDPQWKTSVDPDSGPRLHVTGLLIDSVSFTVLLWAVFFGPGVLRWHMRARYGHCPECRHNLTGNATDACPACGRAIHKRVRYDRPDAARQAASMTAP